MDHRRVAKVLLFFSMVDAQERMHNLTYVQMFKTVSSEPESITGMYRIKLMRQYEVIEIDTIEREVHLIPCFRKEFETIMTDEKSLPALQVYNEF